jgi:hypothetical protein
VLFRFWVGYNLRQIIAVFYGAIASGQALA